MATWPWIILTQESIVGTMFKQIPSGVLLDGPEAARESTFVAPTQNTMSERRREYRNLWEDISDM